MRHGTAERQTLPHDPHPEPTDGLGVRLAGARLERLARMAAELHAQEMSEPERTVGRDAREPRIVRHAAAASKGPSREVAPR